MKNPNSYGSISKLSGNLRKPYRVQITVKWELDENGKAKQIRKNLGYYATKKEAMYALAEYNQNPYNLNKNTATVSDVWQAVNPKLSASDARKAVYKTAWVKYMYPLHNRPISAVKAQELQDIVDACDKGYSTKVVIRTVMKHIFEYAAINDIIQKDYSAFVKVEREETQLERQIYTPEEIADLWNHSSEPLYQFALILLYQGMRITELRELPKENIDLEANTITITKAKNKQSLRTIPIHHKIRPFVVQCMDNAPQGEYLFDYSKRQFEYFVKNNLNHLPYDTRHTFATTAKRLGIDQTIIQKIMGHKPDSVLEQYYTHLSVEDLAAEMNKIDY